MEFEEPDDDAGFYRSPLPPDDRLWRHPSEVGPAVSPIASRRSLWMVAGLSALGASLLSTGLVVAATTLLAGGGDPPVERQMVARPATGVPEEDEVVRIAERVRPAIAQVKVDRSRAGSGVVFRSDGHLLTNAHVVAGADRVTVAMGTGKELSARVVGADPHTDIAVVKVDGDGFPVVTMGTAAHLSVGQKAIAVGSPLGLAGGPSVSVGVVSALHRNVRDRSGTQTMYDMVQTDAAIAPGSSGGALLDGDGSVIGITTAMAVGESGSEGVGFAVPIDLARSVADQLITSGRVVNVWIGIQGQEVDSATATQLRIGGGAMVAEVKAGSPAERGGVAARDVIVGVDGRPISSMEELVMALRVQKPGSTVSLAVVRGGRPHTVRVTLAERPPNA
jgi:S1-C subfamily serine protease